MGIRNGKGERRLTGWKTAILGIAMVACAMTGGVAAAEAAKPRAAPRQHHGSHHTNHPASHPAGHAAAQRHAHAAEAGRHASPRHGAQRQALREQRGHASVYSRRLAGRPMADGGRFDPKSDTVASRTLPLGTQARVTNLRNGRSAVVSVRDRGPHRGGRILDVSPGVAARLGMPETGTAPVAIVALSTPGLAGRAEAAPAARTGR